MARKKKNQDKTETPVEEVQAAPAAGEPPAGQQAAAAADDRAPSDMERLQDELTAAKDEARKNWDLYLRSQADMENFRKRMQREKQEMARFANEGLLRELLPVMDNLQRAVDHAREEQAEATALLEGVEMTLSQFARTLEKFGVTPVEAIGKPFDPSCHEAMGQVVSEEVPPNTVAQELQKGYRLHDRLLRPALVMVSKAPETGASVEAEAATGAGEESETDDN
ncbi:molecular chaperone GrpE [Geothermobacter ehrlichii]|uniref:Protein GrpE n=1 Tax=Geothermobacter ehrlichii TaxID=213224 RepID=A0A5D3WFY3_9BACT|nr:nucleotide exchange factor GrpE [Geothermobacter ehrlichii]TYO96817.1 molecular chaperone GrpE [Geothermobacter ehrlichii]